MEGVQGLILRFWERFTEPWVEDSKRDASWAKNCLFVGLVSCFLCLIESEWEIGAIHHHYSGAFRT